MPEATSLSLIISGAAFSVSLLTVWLTLLRRGTLRMTQPTQFYLGPDGSPHEGRAKVYLRTLLYSTAKRGHVVENMFVRLSWGEMTRNFPIWVVGDEKLARGSGLRVGEDGIVANHHFLLPGDVENHSWKAGEYKVDVFARLVGKEAPSLLFSTHLSIDPEQARRLRSPNTGIYFDWGPDSQRYLTHKRKNAPSRSMPPEVLLQIAGTTGPTDEPAESQ